MTRTVTPSHLQHPTLTVHVAHTVRDTRFNSQPELRCTQLSGMMRGVAYDNCGKARVGLHGWQAHSEPCYCGPVQWAAAHATSTSGTTSGATHTSGTTQQPTDQAGRAHARPTRSVVLPHCSLAKYARSPACSLAWFTPAIPQHDMLHMRLSRAKPTRCGRHSHPSDAHLPCTEPPLPTTPTRPSTESVLRPLPTTATKQTSHSRLFSSSATSECGTAPAPVQRRNSADDSS
jgi:hypothetical protein